MLTAFLVLLAVIFAAAAQPLTAALFVLLIFAVWLGSLYLWPLGNCWKCGGSGRNRGSNGRRFGECRRCGGAKQRIRVGARTVHRGRVSLAERRRAKGGGR